MVHKDREATNSKMKQGTHVKQETENPYGINKGIMYRWNKKIEKQSTVRRDKKSRENNKTESGSSERIDKQIKRQDE